MDWLSRLNLLQEKISNLLLLVEDLNKSNDVLAKENRQLKDEVTKLESELGHMKQSTESYLNERDTIKERVERLIQMLG